jgi:acyl-CoA reductase-like NAD-dependent aldehyde dehydrogenase
MRDAIVAFTRNLKVGEGNEPGVFLGPVQNSTQYERVKGFFSEIKAQNQQVALGGEVDENAKGYYITPTIIDQPAEDSRIVTEEPFGKHSLIKIIIKLEPPKFLFPADTRDSGPIVPLLSWSTEEDVIARANNTKMGLGASVWSNDLEQAERIARQIEAGVVWVNSHLESSPHATIGGHKWSGIGSELGKQGMASFCNTQALFLKK